MRLFIIALLLPFIAGCHAKNHPAPLPPRPDRGYIHLLEKHSMGAQSSDLAAQVSQTERLWLNGGKGEKRELLLEAAPSWLAVNLYALNLGRPLFTTLLQELPEISSLGMQGLYLGPTAEKLDAWVDAGLPEDFGKSAASLSFSEAAGSEDEYAALRNAAEMEGIELGSAFIPAATGRGPDFLLQARGGPASSGTYAMIEVPEESWGELPDAGSEWQAPALDKEHAARAVTQQLIPPDLNQDFFDWGAKSGWAATGQIQGLDGKMRRWLYRYSGSPERPVFLWTDPFGRARQIFAAAAIRQTGLLGQSLAGLHMAALMGLEPGQNPENLEPGLDALNDISGQIHRYGGWTVLADPVPERVIAAVLGTECDFCRDDVIGALFAAALLSGHGVKLAEILEKRKTQNLDFTRLARGLDAWDGADLHLPGHDGDRKLPLTTEKPDPAGTLAERTRTSGEPDRAVSSLLGFRLGLPGLAFISPRELMLASGKAPAVVLPDKSGNTLDSLKQLLAERKRQRLSQGKVLKITRGAESRTLGILSSLPDGSFWLLAINFDNRPRKLSLTLPSSSLRPKAADGGPGRNITLDGQNCEVTLDGKQTQNVVFLKK